ncbi:ArsR/SmtB family transcription factor [Serratia entomophila]|uniref:ArsR/SmtB family transcription factor n=1 Tax=Serratia entomophila TaxID=42906 RepID=UPI00217B016F|nr:metalloregulator ArsR/SmtB family transcription factor [Serratia entomophila]CAI0872727.1 Transcriptional repressor smtB homolog [Serratia entomophila]CAI1512703.1 Transcriptional repressor smtB homolog [Serratia entomophila]CAI1591611.1 Transcriptional repressor smtB homolog [Serratia entomophila]CAI1823416.1 Transcriptional repressor smtB homolog [Serratia entomophila]CAI1884958.1 Transcriptional repressor smtB homolog [Serratia entomophila]
MNETDIFKALADPTRRSIFDKLAAGGMNASALREGMPISQSAMSQHLAVLRNAGLVQERRQGRFVNYQVNPAGLAQITQWLAKYRAYWPERIEALQTLLKELDQ